MRCPKCHQPNHKTAKECEGCGVVFAHISKPASSDTSCACGKTGVIKRDGVWKCISCSGYVPRLKSSAMNYRQRWYAERGLPYEPAKLGDFGTFRSVGLLTLGAIRKREPGDDDEEIAA